MAGVDYAILSEWFDWITANTRLNVDLIGEFSIFFLVDFIFGWNSQFRLNNHFTLFAIESSVAIQLIQVYVYYGHTASVRFHHLTKLTRQLT